MPHEPVLTHAPLQGSSSHSNWPQLDRKGRAVHALKGTFCNLMRGKRIETIKDIAYIPIFGEAEVAGATGRAKRDADTLLKQKCLQAFLRPLQTVSHTGIDLCSPDGQTWLCFPQVCTIYVLTRAWRCGVVVQGEGGAGRASSPYALSCI